MRTREVAVSTIRPIIIVDYTNESFEHVCSRLEALQGQRLTSRGSPIARIGPIDRVSDYAARTVAFDARTTDTRPVAELRALAVTTGREALTELLVFADAAGLTAAGRRVARVRARSILNDALHHIETHDRAVETRAS